MQPLNRWEIGILEHGNLYALFLMIFLEQYVHLKLNIVLPGDAPAYCEEVELNEL